MTTPWPPWVPQRWLQDLALDPAASACLQRAFNRLATEVPDPVALLAQCADQSSFTIDQWLEALAHFQHYVEEQQRQPTITHMIEYVICATHSAEAKLGWRLQAVLGEMLEQFGYIGDDSDRCAL